MFLKIAPSQNNILINTMHDLCLATVGIFLQVWLVKDDNYFISFQFPWLQYELEHF